MLTQAELEVRSDRTQSPVRNQDQVLAGGTTTMICLVICPEVMMKLWKSMLSENYLFELILLVNKR